MSTNEVKEFDEVYKPKEESPKPEVPAKEFQPLISRLNDAQVSDVNKFIPLNEFSIEIDGVSKTFTRKKIKTREYAELEQIRARYALAPTSTEKSNLYFEQFQKAAAFYLGMTQEEFEVCDFETLKKIIDAQNIRTNFGVPNPKTS